MTKTLTTATCALMLLAASASAQEPSARDSIAGIEIHVDGLACPMCAYGLEKKLKALPEIDSVSVDLDKGIVGLKLKPGTSIRDSLLIQTVKDAGFAVRKIERPRKVSPASVSPFTEHSLGAARSP